MIDSIGIENFRQFNYIRVEKFKRVNFFIGKNNCGKTTLLEALFIMADPQNLQAPTQINQFRMLNAVQLMNMFHNLDKKNEIKITTELSERKTNVLEIYPDNSNTIKLENTPNVFAPNHFIPKETFNYNLTVSGNQKNVYRSVLSTDGTQLHAQVINRRPDTPKTGQYIHAGIMYDQSLIQHIGDITLNKKNDELLKVLQYFDTNVEGFSLVGQGIYIDIGIPKLIPLNLMGDGFKKYLSIVASLVVENLNYIFIDEIENGLHFENIKHLIRIIIKISEKYNIQIFITTHSYEVLKYLSEIMQEKDFTNQKNEVSIIKIANTKKAEFKSYNYDTEDLTELIETETEMRG